MAPQQKKTAPKKRKAEKAPAGKEPQSKKARLDTSCDLVNFLTTTDPVVDFLTTSDPVVDFLTTFDPALDIYPASGSRDLPKEVITCQELYFLLCYMCLIFF